MRTASCVAVIPAKDEAQRIAATVRGVRDLPQVACVIVVDDGSSDATTEVAHGAGAEVVRHHRNKGKAAAMTTGSAYAVAQGYAELPVLFVDADLEESARALGALVDPVTGDTADMTIAVLPPQRRAGGGHGFVVRLARDGIQSRTGWQAAQPLSGMRCLSRAALTTAMPLARGWGVEVALTIDVLNAGLRVREVPCELHHRVSGPGWRGRLHRAAQYRDVWLALARRRRKPAGDKP
ncbi:glycosyltransferase family 2 protein [Leekyejoonella antrihumi]|uniref:Glucosyl-3-phosphoglycerate synthase n=1 Tax=Leekyejoonella antrihumi TaxID=1660198 RepID=A0A563E6L1_9MICO|nr:glycosyltransferase family 2 protein [Leekyejoonella antrihumi]TWP38156.1 glycosyltransferase family 2 protein [Leekyejoonella antrihumi]